MNFTESMSGLTNYKTIKVKVVGSIGTLQFYRPESNNTINDLFIAECLDVIDVLEPNINVLVVEGLPEVFCFGADFQELGDSSKKGNGPEELYNLWLRLSTSAFVSIAHVRGKVNAGGVGFVAACDIVVADSIAVFSLSELLFGLFPACVLPFLIKKIGFQKAHYMTLMTKPVSVTQAQEWGLVDVYSSDSRSLVRTHLLRLRKLRKSAIKRYKDYMNSLNPVTKISKTKAIEANKNIFSDRENIEGIIRYVKTGQFPWEEQN